MRPARADGIDERGDELIISGATHALMPPADIERVGEKIVIVRADVEQNRQRR